MADAYQVSVRTVERHARTDAWRQKAREFDGSAIARAREQLCDERAEALVDTERLIGASFVTYASQLQHGEVKVTPADVARLHKLRNEIWAERDDHTDIKFGDEPQTDPIDPTERKLQVVRALDDAGVLRQILEAALDETTDPDEHDQYDVDHGDGDNRSDDADHDDVRDGKTETA